jgi:hypothetical protein
MIAKGVLLLFTTKHDVYGKARLAHFTQVMAQLFLVIFNYISIIFEEERRVDEGHRSGLANGLNTLEESGRQKCLL